MNAKGNPNLQKILGHWLGMWGDIYLKSENLTLHLHTQVTCCIIHSVYQ